MGNNIVEIRTPNKTARGVVSGGVEVAETGPGKVWGAVLCDGKPAR